MLVHIGMEDLRLGYNCSRLPDFISISIVFINLILLSINKLFRLRPRYVLGKLMWTVWNCWKILVILRCNNHITKDRFMTFYKIIAGYSPSPLNVLFKMNLVVFVISNWLYVIQFMWTVCEIHVIFLVFRFSSGDIVL